MKKNRLFGNAIEVDCEYCQNSMYNGSEYLCCVKKTIKNGKCRKFDYNPTLRVPKEPAGLIGFNKNDFKL